MIKLKIKEISTNCKNKGKDLVTRINKRVTTHNQWKPSNNKDLNEDKIHKSLKMN